MDFLKRAFQRMTSQGQKDPSEGNLPKIESISDQTNEEKAIIDYMKRRVQEVRQNGSRIAQESIWMTNYAYLLGFDSVYFDTTQRQFKTVGRATAPFRRNGMNVNKILPTVQRRQARLCKNLPRFEVRPDDATQESKERARLEQQLCEFYFEKERLQEKRLVMMTGLQQCGHYYMHPYWDVEAGDFLAAEVEEKNEVGQTVTKTDYEREGDLKVELVSAFEMFPDPLATSLDDAQWVIRAKVRKLDYFREKYPERGHLVKEDGAWLLSIQNELRINTMNGQGPATTGAQIQMKDAAIELTLYERPTNKHPKGRMVIEASDVLLKDTELDIGEIPFAKFDDMPIAGKFYPEAIVTHLRPIQDQYNRTVGLRADWTNKLLAGKYIAHASAQIQQEALNDQSGEVLYHNTIQGQSAPQAMSIPVIPQYAYVEEERLNEMFYDIAGEGEISRGILPAAGIPAIGMQLLLEQDETRNAIVTEQHEHAFARLMRICTKYLEKFVKNERLLKISDPNSQYTIQSWTGTDLKSKHDVIVTRGSLAPASKSARRNDVMNLYNTGLLGDVMDPQVKASTLSALENGDVYNFWADTALDQAQIQKSIKMIEAELVPEVFEGDNHVLHWKEKNKYRKSDKFEALSPDSQAILLADMETHLKFIQKLTAPQFGMNPNGEQEINQTMDTVQAAVGDQEQTQEDLASLENQENDLANTEAI
jgi:hypothetical protein